MAAEATTTWTVGPQPIFSPTRIVKTVNGKRVESFLPARDENGNVIIDQRRFAGKITLGEFVSDPKWTDRDFRFSRPITNGTRIAIAGAPDSHYVWQDGKVVLLDAPPAPK